MQIDSRSLKPVFKTGFLAMGVVLRGSLMRLKCLGMHHMVLWGNDKLLRCKCMHVLE